MRHLHRVAPAPRPPPAQPAEQVERRGTRRPGPTGSGGRCRTSRSIRAIHFGLASIRAPERAGNIPTISSARGCRNSVTAISLSSVAPISAAIRGPRAAPGLAVGDADHVVIGHRVGEVLRGLAGEAVTARRPRRRSARSGRGSRRRSRGPGSRRPCAGPAAAISATSGRQGAGTVARSACQSAQLAGRAGDGWSGPAGAGPVRAGTLPSRAAAIAGVEGAQAEARRPCRRRGSRPRRRRAGTAARSAAASAPNRLAEITEPVVDRDPVEVEEQHPARGDPGRRLDLGGAGDAVARHRSFR